MSLLLDSHKLQYHPKKVAEFLDKKNIYPIYVEISPVAYCNHKCLFCNYNYLGHKGRFAPGRILSLIEELANAGVKSLVFAGSGEPLLNRETIRAIQKAKDLSMDVALSTNGVLLKEDDFEILAKSLSWIRFSVNGGNPENYAEIHRTSPKDYQKVLENINKLKNKKEELNTDITIGSQFILLPANREFVLNQAKVMKDLGVNYFVVKHFYDHNENQFNVDSNFLSNSYLQYLNSQAIKMSDNSFSFIVRDKENLKRERVYSMCYGLEFIAYISEDGNVYSCFSHQHDNRSILGNIFEKSFQEVWHSRQKREAIDYINNCIDKNQCQANCRHHQINNYLWELKNPTIQHLNFI